LILIIAILTFGRIVSATNEPPANIGTTNEPTIVTSDRLTADYTHNVGTFEGNVLAVDPRITVRSDKMTVWFAATNSAAATTNDAQRSIRKIVAEGAVVINQENRKATSDRAEYTAAEGKVVLTGHPKLENPDGTVTGTRITFWRNQEKIDVESEATETNRTRLIIFPDEMKQKD
jgi:lipopolysaccharide export system protein LptA